MGIITVKNFTKNADKQLSKHFALHEFQCKDGSTTIKYSEETIALLEKLFDKFPVINMGIITSGYRTPEYSVKVGGGKDDAHTKGLAVDIQFKDKNKKIIDPRYICCVAMDIGFTGIGLMKNSVHLDTRNKSNYTNSKWWGDETRKETDGITDYSLSKRGKEFYGYFGLKKEDVYKALGATIETPIPAPKVEETPEPIIEVKEAENKPEEIIEPIIETPAEPKIESDEQYVFGFLRRLIEALIKFFKGE